MGIPDGLEERKPLPNGFPNSGFKLNNRYSQAWKKLLSFFPVKVKVTLKLVVGGTSTFFLTGLMINSSLVGLEF